MPTIRFVALDLDDAVDEQERIAVRHDVQDPADVHARCPPSRCPVRAMARASATLPWWLGRVGDDVRLDPPADEGQVADEVAALWRTNSSGQRSVVPTTPVVGEDDCVLVVAPWVKPLGLERSTSCTNPKVRAPASSRPKLSALTRHSRPGGR